MKNIKLTLAILSLSIVTMQAQYKRIIEPSADNTIYNENPDSLSNGSGEYIFAGTTDKNAKRRALLKFDFDSLPTDAIIDSVELTLTVSKSISGSKEVKLFALTSDWGEGESDAPGEEGRGATAQADDATWTYAFFESSSWNTAGGDFNPVPSDSALAGMSGTSVFTGEVLKQDVIHWFTNPDENFGWIVISDEMFIPSAKRFYSREHADESKRPKLKVYFQSVLASEPSHVNQSALRIVPENGTWIIQSESLSGPHTMFVHSMTGALQCKKQIQIEKGSNIIERESLDAGIYIVTIHGKEGRFAEKVVIL